ncbi:MAG: helix-turn-helix transcriptional regulator [Candidatus Cloacimonetes bacterium]|nr:helix-turn-helix transcriptional regulator [Candidatus Cloacimonadota bacterium]
MSFSERLKQAMEEKNMSQADLCSLTGIGKSSISQYISGKNEPKTKAIEKIAEALQVSTAYMNGLIETNEAGEEKSVPVEKAASLMGKSQQFIRVGLQRGLLPFGSAVKLSSRWTYYINPQRFYDYVGK